MNNQAWMPTSKIAKKKTDLFEEFGVQPVSAIQKVLKKKKIYQFCEVSTFNDLFEEFGVQPVSAIQKVFKKKKFISFVKFQLSTINSKKWKHEESDEKTRNWRLQHM